MQTPALAMSLRQKTARIVAFLESHSAKGVYCIALVFIILGAVLLPRALGGIPLKSESLFTDLGNYKRFSEILFFIGCGLCLLMRRQKHSFAIALFAGGAILAINAVTLSGHHNGIGRENFPERYEREFAKSDNLGYGREVASNLLEGKGFTYDDGKVISYRMPGYPTFVAIVALVTGTNPRDGFGITVNTIIAQTFFLALATVVFVYFAQGAFPRAVTMVVFTMLVFLPTNVDYTQADSIILGCGLLISAMACRYLRVLKEYGSPRLTDVVLLHLAFALYFMVRTDVLIGWLIVSIYFHGKTWRYLVVPVLLFLTIGVAFGVYKMRMGNEFSLTTNNNGHVAFVGLWQVPRHRFVWKPTDASYDGWIKQNGMRYREPGTDAFAVKEIMRFYVTYPGYIVSLFWYKWCGYFFGRIASGTTVYFPTIQFKLTREIRKWMINGLGWFLMTLMLVAIVVNYKRVQVIGLGWAVFLNLPLFCVLQESGGRFVPFVTASLIIGGIPLLLDGGFWIKIYERREVAAPIILVLFLLWRLHSPIDRYLLSTDGFRYWTPILDPGKSTLAVFK